MKNGSYAPDDPVDGIAREFAILAKASYRFWRKITIVDRRDADLLPALKPEVDSIPSKKAFLCRLRALASAPLHVRPDGTNRNRVDMLAASIRSLSYLLDRKSDAPASFSDYTKHVFGFCPEIPATSTFEQIAAELDPLLPGKGMLYQRYRSFLDKTRVPSGKLKSVLAFVMEEARRRTSGHFQLPAGEICHLVRCTIPNVKGYLHLESHRKSKMGYSTTLPFYSHEILKLVCHEAYPGHHVLMLVQGQVLKEFPGRVECGLFVQQSPMATILEGTGEAAMALAFPGDDAFAYESVFCSRFGLPAPDLAIRKALEAFERRRSLASCAIARDLFENLIGENAAKEWLMRYCLLDDRTAGQTVGFCKGWGAYYATYQYGETLINKWLDRGAGNNHRMRWKMFGDLLRDPRLPSVLEAESA